MGLNFLYINEISRKRQTIQDTMYPNIAQKGRDLLIHILMTYLFRALRYYHIGIKSSILLLKSIVSVSYRYRHSRFQKVSVYYQYQNFPKRKYHISISIEFYTLWYHAQYQLVLSMPKNFAKIFVLLGISFVAENSYPRRKF